MGFDSQLVSVDSCATRGRRGRWRPAPPGPWKPSGCGTAAGGFETGRGADARGARWLVQRARIASEPAAHRPTESDRSHDLTEETPEDGGNGQVALVVAGTFVATGEISGYRPKKLNCLSPAPTTDSARRARWSDRSRGGVLGAVTTAMRKVLPIRPVKLADPLGMGGHRMSMPKAIVDL